MRRSLLALLLLPLITACARTSDLPAEVVMERTVQANRNLRSAHVDGTMRFRQQFFLPLQIDEGIIRLEGDLQDAGKQLALELQLTGKRHNTVKSIMDVVADLIILDGSEVFLRLQEMDIDPDLPANDPVRQLSSIPMAAWWSLTPPTFSDDTSVTPDPMLLRMQSEAVRIVHDNGIKSVDGRDVHLFDVRMDAEKLSMLLSASPSSGSAIVPIVPEAEGSLWIDAETYFLHRARWNVRFADGGSTDVNLRFSDHQKPVAIAPPKDALPLPSNAHDVLMVLTGRQTYEEPDTIILTD